MPRARSPCRFLYPVPSATRWAWLKGKVSGLAAGTQGRTNPRVASHLRMGCSLSPLPGTDTWDILLHRIMSKPFGKTRDQGPWDNPGFLPF